MKLFPEVKEDLENHYNWLSNKVKRNKKLVRETENEMIKIEDLLGYIPEILIKGELK